LAKHGGGFKSKKRQKELARLKKQEEKRQRRFGERTVQETGTEEIAIVEGEVTTVTTVTEEKAKDPE
jgi:hypothetical protein